MAKLEFKTSRLKQLDQTLISAAQHIPKVPRKGWLHEIRSNLMLTTEMLAKRVGIDQSVASRFEKSEVNKTITLSSLSKMANALGCEVQYILVPKVPLSDQVWQQAKKKLESEDRNLKHTMSLEQQESNSTSRLNDDIRIAFLIHERGSKIWDDRDEE